MVPSSPNNWPDLGDALKRYKENVNDPLTAETNQAQQQTVENKEHAEAIAPKVKEVQEEIAKTKDKLDRLLEKSDVLKGLNFNTLVEKKHWKAKVDAIYSREQLAAEIDNIDNKLALNGVAANHETRQQLADLRAEVTPNYFIRSGLNAAEFTYKKPLMAAVGIFGLYWLNRLVAKATGESFGGRLLRFAGIGFAATLLANHFNARERRLDAAKKTAVAQPKFPGEASAEALAIDVTGAQPQVDYAGWSEGQGSVRFQYPGPANVMPAYPTYGPPMPFHTVAPQPVGGFYLNPNMNSVTPPPFMPQQSFPYEGGRPEGAGL